MLSLTDKICPDCGAELYYEFGEFICQNCGLEVDEYNLEKRQENYD